MTRKNLRGDRYGYADKGKQFLNKQFQGMLRDEGIQFQVCRNPDVKCTIVERAQRMIRDKLYKYYFSRPLRVTDSYVLAIWKRMSRRLIRVAQVKFTVGQHVRISKETMKFAKGGEQNFSTEIFRITKVIQGRPRPVYELEDLNKTPIEGQF